MLADDTVSGRLAALDLLIEAEHGPDLSAYLVSTSRTVVDEAIGAINEYWKSMSRQRVEFSSTVLTGKQGGILLAESMDDAIAFINEYAPEHLEILSRDPFAYLGKIANAGEILMGPYTPVTLGNLCWGPMPSCRPVWLPAPCRLYRCSIS